MNKKIISLLVMAGMTMSAGAALTQFQWSSAVGSLKNQTNSNISSAQATILTYLSSDSVINFNSLVPLSATYGNDVFYAALGNSLSGKVTTSQMLEATGLYIGKSVYCIALNMPLATFNSTYGGLVANVPLGTYYAVSQMVGPLADATAPATPQAFASNALVTSAQVIPEPATALLFGIGAMGAWMVRRNKIRSKEQADA